MKVTEISIKLVPNQAEEQSGLTSKLLIRTEKKLWFIEGEQGMHPMFIDLAKRIQDAIGLWGGG